MIATKSREENLAILHEVLNLLRRHNLPLKRSKCFFLQTKISFSGYEIDKHGIRPNNHKILAVICELTFLV
jgi:hypothetical protein